LSVIVQYVGFVTTARGREYNFLVREASNEPREFTLSIASEAFDSHRVRYQDAADICSRKLHRELEADADHSPQTSYRISDAELQDYRDSHAPKGARSLYPRNAVRNV
jgi:hypothetical protein